MRMHQHPIPPLPPHLSIKPPHHPPLHDNILPTPPAAIVRSAPATGICSAVGRMPIGTNGIGCCIGEDIGTGIGGCIGGFIGEDGEIPGCMAPTPAWTRKRNEVSSPRYTVLLCCKT